MGIKRIENNFLSSGVIGKWNRMRGVKCILFYENFYILEGDIADGYSIHTISQDVVQSAGCEVCEAAVKLYIENCAIEEFYYEDGSGYKSFVPEDFSMLKDEKLVEEIRSHFKNIT